MTTVLPAPPTLESRSELETIVRRDLLGPAGGPEEEVDERAVRGRYILGLLAPRGADFARLRDLHVETDRAVAAAYGWSDLELGLGFHETAQGVRFTISEAARREVLGRLLELNHQRYAEEVAAGMHEKGKVEARAEDQAKPRRARRGETRPEPDAIPRLFDSGEA